MCMPCYTPRLFHSPPLSFFSLTPLNEVFFELLCIARKSIVYAVSAHYYHSFFSSLFYIEEISACLLPCYHRHHHRRRLCNAKKNCTFSVWLQFMAVEIIQQPWIMYVYVFVNITAINGAELGRHMQSFRWRRMVVLVLVVAAVMVAVMVAVMATVATKALQQHHVNLMIYLSSTLFHGFTPNVRWFSEESLCTVKQNQLLFVRSH